MRYIPLAMLRPDLERLPSYTCPEGYSLRMFGEGDERAWARIETAAGEFPDEERALLRFEEDYGTSRQHLRDRCFLLRDDDSGSLIGTATAWFGEYKGRLRGRVGWVAIVPEFQGRGLAKPLLSAVMQRLAREYASAYLTTQTTSYRAINLYLAFGFVPSPVAGGDQLSEEQNEGWSIVEHTLHRPILGPS